MDDMQDSMQGANEQLAEVKKEFEYSTSSPLDSPLAETVKQEVDDFYEHYDGIKEEDDDDKEEEEELQGYEEEDGLSNSNEMTPDRRQLRTKSRPDQIKCNQCYELFDKTEIMSHIINMHPKENVRLFCNDCGKGFIFRTGLILHRAKQHGGELPNQTRNPSEIDPHPEDALPEAPVLLCEICHKTFRHHTSLSVHLQNHDLDEIYECKTCEQPFIDKDRYETHVRSHDDLDPNQCYVCGQVFKRSVLCREHVKRHKADARYRCKQCHKAFQEPTHLAIHTVQHAEKRFECSICQKHLRSREKLEQHKHVHYQYGKSTRCQACHKTFPSGESLRNHIKLVHQKRKGHLCQFCGVTFFKLKQLQVHSKEHVFDKVLTCKMCDEKFNERSKLKLHMQMHVKCGSNFGCLVCPKQFLSDHDLQKHVSDHAEDDSLDCSVCGQQLANTDEIMQHVNRHKAEMSVCVDGGQANSAVATKQRQRRVQEKCPVCEKTFHFASSLQSHMHIHDTEQNMKCHICKESLVGVKRLRQHLKSVHGKDFSMQDRAAKELHPITGRKKNRHRCDICLERFGCYYTMKTHRLLHTGVKPFVCEICGLGYVLAGSLRFHMFSHIKDRPHVCEVCGKGFKQLYILREHQMSHTGIKPFLCDLCGKSFVNRMKLKLHKFVHTRETPFNCKVCGRGFRAFVTRQKHKCEGRPRPADPVPLPSVEEEAAEVESVGAACHFAGGSQAIATRSGAASLPQPFVQLSNYPESEAMYVSMPGGNGSVAQQQGQQLYGDGSYQTHPGNVTNQAAPLLSCDFGSGSLRYRDIGDTHLPMPGINWPGV